MLGKIHNNNNKNISYKTEKIYTHIYKLQYRKL